MKGKSHTIDALFVVVLFCVFSASVLLVLLFGTSVYKSMSERSSEAYEQRTYLYYLSQKVRQGDSQNAVRVADFSGCSAIYITHSQDDVEYNSIIYCYDGWLRELFCESSMEFSPEDGEKIAMLDSAGFSRQGELICARLESTRGQPSWVYISLRSGGTV